MTHPVAPFPTSLRKDLRQWLIHDDPTLAAVVHALEAGCMSAIGQGLARHDDVELRAIGNVLQKLGELRARIALAEGPEAIDSKAVAAVTKVLGYAFTGTRNVDGLAVALDELHAAVYQLDHYLNRAGAEGAGLLRSVARGEA